MNYVNNHWTVKSQSAICGCYACFSNKQHFLFYASCRSISNFCRPKVLPWGRPVARYSF